MLRPFLASLACLLAVSATAAPPDGYRQVVPRGRIAAIDAPVYVSADEARIPAGAFVLGVVVEGQPFAYSVNLLNAHEVVNDEHAGTRFAAVW